MQPRPPAQIRTPCEVKLEVRLLEALDDDDLGEIATDFIEKLRECARAIAAKGR